jgi:hypothetical protein
MYDDEKLVGIFPAMVVRLDDADGNVIGIHRTWFDPRIDANPVSKAPVPAARKTLGHQGIAWLGRKDVKGIIIGEGVETVLGASQLGDENLPSWGLTPVSTISASGFGRLVLPDCVRRAFLCEHADDAGRKATKSLATRLSAEGRAITIIRIEENVRWASMLMMHYKAELTSSLSRFQTETA